jgi:hypothetical protein
LGSFISTRIIFIQCSAVSVLLMALSAFELNTNCNHASTYLVFPCLNKCWNSMKIDKHDMLYRYQCQIFIEFCKVCNAICCLVPSDTIFEYLPCYTFVFFLFGYNLSLLRLPYNRRLRRFLPTDLPDRF